MEFSAQSVVNYFNSNNEANKNSFEKKTLYNYIDKLQKSYLIVA